MILVAHIKRFEQSSGHKDMIFGNFQRFFQKSELEFLSKNAQGMLS